VQPGGIPLFSQSLNFSSDFECQTFNKRLVDLDVNPILLGGLFEAIQSLFSEIMNDNLKLIDISFHSYRVSGLVYGQLLYLGIFDLAQVTEESQIEFFPYLGEIASKFKQKFPSILTQTETHEYSQFDGFADDLIAMGYAVEYQDCRNCLSRCSDENKHCIPHLYYYKEAQVNT
jgi:hypothetical protein